MDLFDLLDGLEFHDDGVLDKQVQSVFADMYISEVQIDLMLHEVDNSSFGQGYRKRIPVHALEISRTQRLVNVDRGTQYLRRELLMLELMPDHSTPKVLFRETPRYRVSAMTHGA